MPVRGVGMAAVALKLGLALWLGPLEQPDSGAYITLAKLILAGSDWFSHLDLHTLNVTAFRMIGYPAVIAAAMALLGAGWAWGVILLQAVAGLGAAALVWRAGRALTGSERLGAAAALCYLVGPSLQADLFLLTDGLYSHMLAMVVALAVLWSCEGRAPTAGRVLGLGLLLALTLLIRSPTMPLGVLFLAPVAVWTVGVAGWRRGPALAALFLLPLFALTACYLAWNKGRSGEAFLSTDSRHALIQPLIALQGRGVPIFTGDGPLDVAGRVLFAPGFHPGKEEVVTGAFVIGNHLVEQQGLSEVEALRLVKARFFETLRAHPLAFAANIGHELGCNILFVLFDPLRVLRKTVAYRADTDGLDARHDFLAKPLSQWRPLPVLFLAGEVATRATAALLLLAFLAAAPLAARGALRGDIAELRLLALVALALGFVGAMAMVHLEERYIIGVLSAMLFAALATLPRLRRLLPLPDGAPRP